MEETTWKVIAKDNLNREGPGYDDVLVEAGFKTKQEASALADKLNEAVPPWQRHGECLYYEAVKADYELQEFVP
jgi:hypothetical protein